MLSVLSEKKIDEVARVEMMHDYDIADKVYRKEMEEWAEEAEAPIPPTGIGKDYEAAVYFKCVSSR